MKALVEDYDANGRNALPFEVWATRIVDFADRDDERERGGLELLEPAGPLKLNPGDSGRLLVRLNGFVPAEKRLRVGMGRGVHARIDDIRPLRREAGADVVLSYAVAKGAGEGARALRLQQGSTRLRLADIVRVTR